jgi:hypothetical protein
MYQDPIHLIYSSTVPTEQNDFVCKPNKVALAVHCGPRRFEGFTCGLGEPTVSERFPTIKEQSTCVEVKRAAAVRGSSEEKFRRWPVNELLHGGSGGQHLRVRLRRLRLRRLSVSHPLFLSPQPRIQSNGLTVDLVPFPFLELNMGVRQNGYRISACARGVCCCGD